MQNKQIMVISVMDRDRPGIVAEVAEGINGLGGSLADLRQSVLCGWFTMIVVAGFSKDVSVEAVEKALSEKTSLRVSVACAREAAGRDTDLQHAYVLSAVGRDRIGLVAQVSRFCCDRGVNILDFSSHVADDQYTMMMLLDLSGFDSIDGLTDELAAFSDTTGLKLVLQHNDIFKAANEI